MFGFVMGPNGALGRPKPRCPSSARPNGAPKKLAGRGPLPQTQSGVSTSAPKPAPAGFGAGSGRGHGAICDTLTHGGRRSQPDLS